MAARRKRRKKKNNKKFLFLILIVAIIVGSVFYSDKIISFIENYIKTKPIEEISKSKNNVLKDYTVFGIDVSEYQKEINWEKIAKDTSIKFVFIRATAGIDRIDRKFRYNWQQSKKYKITRGAYHYYRPNENSRYQAKNFIKNVHLEHGDFPPVLDIERFSSVQSLKSLKNGVYNWLKIVEEHYGVKPILYTYHNFYLSVFRGDDRFDDYPLWIAFYNVEKKPDNKIGQWIFWQFTDKGKIDGISEPVDLNVFYLDIDKLKSLTIK